MEEAKRLNVHCNCKPGETEDELHAEDCQPLAEAVVSMGERSLAHLTFEGYLHPHHVAGMAIEDRAVGGLQATAVDHTEARAERAKKARRRRKWLDL